MSGKKSFYCNFLIISGLSMLGAGIYLSFGLGPAIAVPGALMLMAGVVGLVR